MTIPTHQHGLSESGKANLVVCNIEYCVVASHKGLPQGPGSPVFLLHNCTKASIRANRPATDVEFRQGEFPTSDIEGNGRDRGVARISPEFRASIFGTRDV
jgi:hypothetical protein